MTDEELIARLLSADLTTPHYERDPLHKWAANRIKAQAAEIERLRGDLAKAVENTLDAASAYMTEQYGISALSHPVDRARAIATLA